MAATGGNTGDARQASRGKTRSWWPFPSCHFTRSHRCSFDWVYRPKQSPFWISSTTWNSQWMENPVFTPKDWSVYKQPIRTNNDIEGWHNALNRRAGGQCNLPLYYLIELLDREAKLTALTIRLVSERKLKRMQRKTYRHLQAKLFEYWEQYDNRQKTASQLLKVCSHLNGPAR